MKVPTLKDSNGRESITLLMVVVSWHAVFWKFVLAGVTVPILDWKIPAMGALEFGGATAALLAIWLGHDWRAMSERVKNKAIDAGVSEQTVKIEQPKGDQND